MALIVLLFFAVVAEVYWGLWNDARANRVRARLLDLDRRTLPMLVVRPVEFTWIRQAVCRLLLDGDMLTFWAFALHPSVRQANPGPESNPLVAPFFDEVVGHVEELYKIHYPVTYWVGRLVKGSPWPTPYVRRITRYLGRQPIA